MIYFLADLLTTAEIKDESYKSPENEERARKNGCFTLCILQKRGLVSINYINTYQLI